MFRSLWANPIILVSQIIDADFAILLFTFSYFLFPFFKPRCFHLGLKLLKNKNMTKNRYFKANNIYNLIDKKI